MIYHKGMVTFVILVLLSSGLTILMLLNDDILHWHLSALHQRKLDVQQMLVLQRQNEEKSNIFVNISHQHLRKIGSKSLFVLLKVKRIMFGVFVGRYLKHNLVKRLISGN